MRQTQDYLVFKFTTKEYEYLNYLSEVTGMPKHFLIKRASIWLQNNGNNKSSLNFANDFDKETNPWRKLNIYCTIPLKNQLKEQADEIGVTRYELVRALIKKVPELINTGEFFEINMSNIEYDEFKRSE